MNSQFLQCQPDDTRMEHEAALQKLKEAEDKIKAYEAATQLAYHEVGQMQNELQNEQRCLEKAVRVASRLYSRNTELKRLSMRQRTIAPSQRRQAWKDKRSKDALELTLPASRVKVAEHESATTDTNDVEDVSEEEEDDESSDDLDEIVGLDNRSKSDLDNALEKAGSLRKINHEMSTKLSKLEDNEKGYETTVRQLQAVIKMKDDELKALKGKYDVEAQVRQRAETYAARMYGKNKAFQRQSVLMKSGRRDSFEDKLESTMKELERLTAELEEEKMAHKQEVQRLEEELKSALSGEKTSELENKISLLLIEVEQLTAHKDKLEIRNTELESQIQPRGDPGMSAPPPPPIAPPPPPPPPPPPIATMPQGASQSIYELIAERKANKTDGDSTEDQMKKKSSTLPTKSGYADAMEEMMRRIKSGNALKKTSTVTRPNAGFELDDTYASISDGGSSGESSGESEYDQIYSEVGALERRPTTVQKAATIGGYASKPITADVKPSGMFNFAALRQVKKRNKSDHDTLEDSATGPKNEFQLRKTPFPRDSGFQDSVRLPKDINPDLKKILEKRRLGMKKIQSESDKS